MTLADKIAEQQHHEAEARAEAAERARDAAEDARMVAEYESRPKWTPGPWVSHGAFYTHGVKGDVFAKDARDVHDATPICRVVAPVSHRKSRESLPIDALHAIAKRKEQSPIIEANARLIAAAPELVEALENLANAAAATQGFASPMFLKDARALLARIDGEQP
jgi:hypothetical protein